MNHILLDQGIKVVIQVHKDQQQLEQRRKVCREEVSGTIYLTKL